MALCFKLLTKRLHPISPWLKPQLNKQIFDVARIVSIPFPIIPATTVKRSKRNFPAFYSQIQPQGNEVGDRHRFRKSSNYAATCPNKKILTFYGDLQPQKKDKETSDQKEKSKTENIFNSFPESLLFRKNEKEPKRRKKRIPKLILIQNPFSWLMIKIDFSVLKNIWDPSFHEKEFKYGTKQAISRITHLISAGSYTELNGLLTKAARLSLMRELDRNWSEKQRSLLALKHEDIQISSPRKVYFIRIADKKYCDVDMAFLALKWAPINNVDALIFTEIFARFHREYTPHCIPEWTIAFFKVTRFEVLRR